MLDVGGSYATYELTDPAYHQWLDRFGPEGPLPDYFVEARRLSPAAHLDMQAALQPFVDQAISKTINVPEDHPYDDFRSLYEQAYTKGLKGCTTFRPNAVTGAVLTSFAEGGGEGVHARHCCSIEREAD